MDRRLSCPALSDDSTWTKNCWNVELYRIAQKTLQSQLVRCTWMLFRSKLGQKTLNCTLQQFRTNLFCCTNLLCACSIDYHYPATVEKHTTSLQLLWGNALCIYPDRSRIKHLRNLRFALKFCEGVDFTHSIDVFPGVVSPKIKSFPGVTDLSVRETTMVASSSGWLGPQYRVAVLQELDKWAYVGFF